MFASNPDQPFNSPMARKLIEYVSRKANAPCNEPAARERHSSQRRVLRDNVSPVSQSLSMRVTRRSVRSRGHVVTDNELQAQEWLDDRLAAFYPRGMVYGRDCGVSSVGTTGLADWIAATAAQIWTTGQRSIHFVPGLLAVDRAPTGNAAEF